jgi:hypothetical protein
MILLYAIVWSLVILAFGFFVSYKRLKGVRMFLSILAVLFLTALLANEANDMSFSIALTTFFIGLGAGAFAGEFKTKKSPGG